MLLADLGLRNPPLTEYASLQLLQQRRNRTPLEPKKKWWQSCFDFLFLFIQTSSIHGFQHITAPRRHFLEYALWTVFISVGVVASGYLSRQSYNRYQNDPTVIALERDYKNWVTSLPAGTVCPRTKFNKEKLQEYLKTFPDEEKNGTKEFLGELAAVTYETLKNLKYKEANINPDDFMKVLHQVNFPFQGIPKDSLWDQVYHETITEMGICHAYNSQIAVYTWPKFFFMPISAELVPNGTAELTAGTPNGGYLAYALKELNDDVETTFVASNDVPDIATKITRAKWGEFTILEFLAQSTTYSPTVGDLSIRQRKCRLMNESHLSISPKYSYNLCRMNCRWQLSQKLCNCAPHFYRKVDGVKICDFKGLLCLANHTDHLVKLRMPITDKKEDCKCLPTCEDNNYFEDDYQAAGWYNSTNIEWNIKKYPRIRFRRELIFGFTDLLISIGGVAGLFLGCSVLSFVEIFYFFTLRLFFHIVKKK